jgi:protein gp37
MENSKISWTHHTANLWWGCQKVHAGCDHCYAETLDNRYNHQAPHWGPHVPRKMVNSVWKDLARFQRDAAAEGVIKRVFVGSMMDIFEKPFPLVDSKGNKVEGMTTDDLRQRFFTEVVPNSPNLLFLLLTKRPGNIKKYIPGKWLYEPPVNVMYGTSVVNQETANMLIPELLTVPGKHFLSCEPMLGLMDITQKMINYSVPTRYTDDGKGIEWTDPGKDFIGIDWVIAGGESGHGARPMNVDWASHIRNQCEAVGVPFFFKQWGEHLPVQEVASGFIQSMDGSNRQFSKGTIVRAHGRSYARIGKHEAGALLNGKEHKNFPLL